MSGITAVAKRELKSYFATPVAYVFIVVFLVAAGAFTFYFGDFYDRGQADLNPFFTFHPWLFLFFVPALAMRLWAEERRSGTIELLMTLPIEPHEAVVGKFLAAWAFTCLAIALTFPIWITVNYLGSPDNGVILAAYVGSAFMAGGFLAVGSFVSAITKNQVIAFVLAVMVSFLLLLAGHPFVLDAVSALAPSQAVVDGIASLSFLTHFESISRGVIDLRDVVYFVLLIATALYASVVVLSINRAS